MSTTTTTTPADRFAKLREAFPDYPVETLPEIPAHWRDRSWRNDAMPCFIVQERTLPSGQTTGLEVYIDYLDVNLRETGPGGRFTLLRREDDANTEHLTETDDWAVLLEQVAQHSTPLPQFIADSFLAMLRKELGEEDFATVCARNACDPAAIAGQACHSHDFCDANVLMLEAFTEATGREPFWPCDVDAGECTQADADADTDLMSAAWADAMREMLAQARVVR